MQFTFKVERKRQSVTQGTATVLLNDIEIITFGDKIELMTKDRRSEVQQFYGPEIGQWASVKSDKDFIQGVLCPHYVNRDKIKDKISRVLEKTSE